jgi:hypothetical protein
MKLVRLGQRFTREGLEIHGLPSGKYRITIDGEEVAVVTAAELEDQIALQNNRKTPQFRQALEVAELNKRRNDGPVKLLRNEWGVFQQAKRLEQAAKADPSNEQLAKQAAELTQRLEGMEDRVRQHEAAARTLEDEIFQKNQPRERTFVITRIDS